MTLYLLRHGIAVERDRSPAEADAARRLTPLGRRKLRRVAAAMRAMELSFDLILSSPLVRARQTAELIVRHLRMKREIRITTHLSPGASSTALVRELTGLIPAPVNVLLVGHEPDLSSLASLWLTGGRGMSMIFKKAGLCKLSVERLRAGHCATLEWMLPPRLSELMA